MEPWPAMMEPSIPEWPKSILWKKAFKKSEGVWSVLNRRYSSNFLKAVSNCTCFILEQFDSHAPEDLTHYKKS